MYSADEYWMWLIFLSDERHGYPVKLSHADRRVGCRSVTRAHIIDWVRSPNFIS